MAAEHAEPLRNALPHQEKVFAFYNSFQIQMVVAGMIGANFLTNIIEKEVDPDGNDDEGVFQAFELFYNIIFTLELGINIYAHWFIEFWRSGWNYFDVVVVTIGVVNTVNLPLHNSFRLLRLMRAFRVFRLFRRVKSLNKIVVAMARAVPGVVNAFLILGIVMSIYAILAVEFYSKMATDHPKHGAVCEAYGNHTLRTSRGYCWGTEYFGIFSKSLFTFFQVMTGDSWSEYVARPCIWYFWDSWASAYGGMLFYVSYTLITQFVLTNVVVAMLLNGFSDDKAQEDEAEKLEAEREEASKQGAIANDAPEDDDIEPGSAGVIKGSNIDVVEQKVARLILERDKVRADLDSFTSEMAELKDKLAIIMQHLSSG